LSAATEGLEQPATTITVTHVVVVIGVALFARWLIATSLGRKALVDSKPRRNRMAPYTPLIPFFLWLMGVAMLRPVAYAVVGTVEGWHRLFLDNLVFSFVSVATVGLVLVIAGLSFARGLRGFGLRPGTIPKDAVLAFLELLAVWPLVLAMITVTMAVGQIIWKYLWSKDFQMPQHEGLELITQSSALPLQVLIVVLAVVVAPVVEEMLFRGLFQTMVRSYLRRPWSAITITSLLFAMTHQNSEHWPALFVLAMGLGYSYEKSGSLFRPILMHALFNGITIASALIEQAPT
jgi:membrane protease YdiL (CAAX protease family)